MTSANGNDGREHKHLPWKNYSSKSGVRSGNCIKGLIKNWIGAKYNVGWNNCQQFVQEFTSRWKIN